MRDAARWSEAAANLDRAHIDQFAGAAAGVLARERAAPAPAVRRGGLDQPAFDAHAVAGAHLAQLACHPGVGGDHVHVGAAADRSEERRGGKEGVSKCRTPGWPCREKKIKTHTSRYRSRDIATNSCQ